MTMKKHDHYWSYEHAVYEGRAGKPGEVGVVRYCAGCGAIEMAFAAAWAAPPAGYDLEAARRLVKEARGPVQPTEGLRR